MTSEQDWFIGVLRGAVRWPPDPNADPDGSGDRVLAAALDGGVAVPIFHALRRDEVWGDLPDALRAGLTRCAMQAAAWEMATHDEVVGVLDALGTQGIDALLLKGAALAHLLYLAPEQRVRSDTDLLLRDRAAADRAAAVLADLGYERSLGVEGRFISHEFACSKPGPGGDPITFDIHWKISNSNFFSSKLTFRELWGSRLAVESLGRHAFTLGFPDALLLALFHRAWHLGEGKPERLIWLYDIHLIAKRFVPGEWLHFTELAVRCQLGPICLDGLREAEITFGTPIPTELFPELERASGKRDNQLALKEPGLRRALVDMGSLPTWRDRIRMVAELLFPSRVCMAQRFGVDSAWRLPWAYLKRAIGGMRKRIRP
jgi:hypothetical protein